MSLPPSDERWKVLKPSVLPVPYYSVHGVIISVGTTSYHYCVSYGVRDGAGPAVINSVKNIMITSLHLILTMCHI